MELLWDVCIPRSPQVYERRGSLVAATAAMHGSEGLCPVPCQSTGMGSQSTDRPAGRPDMLPRMAWRPESGLQRVGAPMPAAPGAGGACPAALGAFHDDWAPCCVACECLARSTPALRLPSASVRRARQRHVLDPDIIRGVLAHTAGGWASRHQRGYNSLSQRTHRPGTNGIRYYSSGDRVAYAQRGFGHRPMWLSAFFPASADPSLSFSSAKK